MKKKPNKTKQLEPSVKKAQRTTLLTSKGETTTTTRSRQNFNRHIKSKDHHQKNSKNCQKKKAFLCGYIYICMYVCINLTLCTHGHWLSTRHKPIPNQMYTHS